MSGALPSVMATLDRCVMISLAVRAHCLLGNRFGSDLFSMPALNMLFDLYAREDRRPRSLTSLCGASKAPARTALRMIHRMIERNLLVRTPDPRDQRQNRKAFTDRCGVKPDQRTGPAPVFGRVAQPFMRAHDRHPGAAQLGCDHMCGNGHQRASRQNIGAVEKRGGHGTVSRLYGSCDGAFDRPVIGGNSQSHGPLASSR